MIRIPRTMLLFTLTAALSACGGGKPAASAPAGAPPPAATPAVQKIFDTTCKSCHGVIMSGAPQAGDKAAWAPRVAQGREVVLDHIINGYKRMPPMGMCMHCSEDEFVAVTEYMSGAKLPQ
jgi:cytochrome c5